MAAMTTTVKVFGKPITGGTRSQRAVAAMNNQFEGGKFDQVSQTTNQSQKVAVATATVSTTICRVYNATGDEVKYVTSKDWNGKVVGTYPVSINNGQWAVFQHEGTKGKDRQPSIGAVVYGIPDYADLMVSWNNPWKTAKGGNNTAYCEMDNPGHFGDGCDWEAIKKQLLASGTETKTSMGGYVTKVTIEEGGNAPIFTATFCLDA